MLSCFSCPCDHRVLHSFPTRRSSDLSPWKTRAPRRWRPIEGRGMVWHFGPPPAALESDDYCDAAVTGTKCGRDRKSTRLNSSLLGISYAVFCLKKKKKNTAEKPFLWG